MPDPPSQGEGEHTEPCLSQNGYGLFYRLDDDDDGDDDDDDDGDGDDDDDNNNNNQQVVS